MGKLIDVTGQRFGRLVAICRVSNKGTRSAFFCLCDCGGATETTGHKLRSGHSQSCGCMTKERLAEANKTHGRSGTDLHNIWKEMRGRCLRPTHARYERYGGRGISVCEEWGKFDRFAEDVGQGYAPGLQLDRIDNNGDYRPGNVRWVDAKTNVRNGTACKINAEDAGAVKSLINMGCKPKRVADMMGISKYVVHDICRNRTWKDVAPLW